MADVEAEVEPETSWMYANHWITQFGLSSCCNTLGMGTGTKMEIWTAGIQHHFSTPVKQLMFYPVQTSRVERIP